MRKSLLLFAALFFTAIAWSQSVTINFNNGSSVKYDLNTIKSVVFDKDDGTEGDWDNDDSMYFQVTINGETYNDDGWCLSWLALFSDLYEDKTTFPYCASSSNLVFNSQDAIEFSVFAGYTSKDVRTIIPKPVGTYDVVINPLGEELWNENMGMSVSGGNMKYRTVSSGSMKITKVSKVKSALSKLLFDREDGYATEGTFDFTLTDNWDGNQTRITGKFRLAF